MTCETSQGITLAGPATWNGSYSGSLLTGTMQATLTGATNTSFTLTWVEQIAVVTTQGDCNGSGVGSLAPTGTVAIGGSVTELTLNITLVCT